MHENSRIAEIREAEKKSHIDVYTQKTLFEEGSWLAKPVKTVMDMLPLLDGKSVRVLDLGCGVGRNAIPAARYFADRSVDCLVDCVDILELAVGQLEEYAKKYRVQNSIRGAVMLLEDFPIERESYDLIVAVSALEHVAGEECFFGMLQKIRAGVRPGGIVCIVTSSNITERDSGTGEPLCPQYEVNLRTDECMKALEEAFGGWEIIRRTVRGQQYTIPRGRMVSLSADVVTWAVRRLI